jgi:pimeloyl-ACP methyl ester carboxylesterase
MSDPQWQEAFVRGVTESLRQGVDGWLHEGLVLEGGWDEIDIDAIKTTITWWASDHDRNCPLSAVRRLVGRLPNTTLNVWTDAGHLTGYRHEGEVLDELLGRC